MEQKRHGFLRFRFDIIGTINILIAALFLFDIFLFVFYNTAVISLWFKIFKITFQGLFILFLFFEKKWNLYYNIIFLITTITIVNYKMLFIMPYSSSKVGIYYILDFLHPMIIKNEILGYVYFPVNVFLIFAMVLIFIINFNYRKYR